LNASASARIQDPRFRVLIHAAGGVALVDRYCTGLLASVPKPPPPVRSSGVPTSILPSAPRVRVSSPHLP
jgi:hypothetical protein